MQCNHPEELSARRAVPHACRMLNCSVFKLLTHRATIRNRSTVEQPSSRNKETPCFPRRLQAAIVTRAIWSSDNWLCRPSIELPSRRVEYNARCTIDVTNPSSTGVAACMSPSLLHCAIARAHEYLSSGTNPLSEMKA